MYREQASQSALSGVPSGPYGGGRKEIDPARLAPGTLAKLAGSMNGMHPPGSAEVYGLFFRGPPRVPLREGEADGGPP